MASKKQEEKQKAAEAQAGLPAASLLGAVYIVALVAGVFYAVPTGWQEFVAPTVVAETNDFVNVALRVMAQLATLIVLGVIDQRFAGANPPAGLRGGIFLAMSVLVTVFFISRAVAMDLLPELISDQSAGLAAWGVLAAVLMYLGWRFLNSQKGRDWASALEHQGWFTATPYKRSQGLKVRRLTMLGILIITLSGVWALYQGASLIGIGDWELAMPFGLQSMLVLPDVRFSLPLVLAGLSLWFTYRVVNVPAFGDFLIATEAEINKVSWSTRKQLVRDTITVLITVVLLAVFLMFVDLFWGWLLSRSFIGILPGEAEKRWVVTDPGATDLKLGQEINGAQREAKLKEYGTDDDPTPFESMPAADVSAKDLREVKW